MKLWMPEEKAGPGWLPNELVRIIGYDNEMRPIVVRRPEQYDMDKYYPDGPHK